MNIIPVHRCQGYVSNRTVNMNYGRGGIAMSKRLVKELGAEIGMVCHIALNDEDNKWYLSVTESGEGFPLMGHPTYKDGRKGGLRFVSASAVRQILGSINCDRGATFMVATKSKVIDGVKWYKIITDKPIRVTYQNG